MIIVGNVCQSVLTSGYSYSVGFFVGIPFGRFVVFIFIFYLFIYFFLEQANYLVWLPARF